MPVSVPEFRGALMTFPAGSGLGWDGIHPRALDRLDDATIQLLIDLLGICERLGKWPLAIQLVIVVLLPKNDGGAPHRTSAAPTPHLDACTTACRHALGAGPG